MAAAVIMRLELIIWKQDPISWSYEAFQLQSTALTPSPHTFRHDPTSSLRLSGLSTHAPFSGLMQLCRAPAKNIKVGCTVCRLGALSCKEQSPLISQHPPFPWQLPPQQVPSFLASGATPHSTIPLIKTMHWPLSASVSPTGKWTHYLSHWHIVKDAIDKCSGNVCLSALVSSCCVTSHSQVSGLRWWLFYIAHDYVGHNFSGLAVSSMYLQLAND